MRVIANFLLGEYFIDALRNTLCIVLPVALFFFYGKEEAAIGTGIGALLISLTDLPGNRSNKKRTALLSIAVFFVTALVFSVSMGHEWLLAGAFFLMTFLLSMLSVFGGRSGLTGTMAIILSTFILGLKPVSPWSFGFYILAGSCWYYLISLTQTALSPYRSLRYAIFECLKATAVLLRSKAKCYDPKIPLDACYRENIALHIVVSEKQELVRNLLLSDRKALKPDNKKGGHMLKLAKRVIELYEQITAIHADYTLVRKVLGENGALPVIRMLVILLAEETDALSRSFLLLPGGKWQTKRKQIDKQISRLKDIVAGSEERAKEILKPVIRNAEEIRDEIFNLKSGHGDTRFGQHLDAAAYMPFLEQPVLNYATVRRHLSLDSPVFRFSLRLALSLLVTYLITLLLPAEKYSYWLLLTVVIVARPRFGITWKRNKERLSGTLMGVMLGFVVLLVIKQTDILLIISAVLLLGFFAFNRPNYTLSVMCITPAVIISLGLYHSHTEIILLERTLFTVAGCLIAFLGLYLFPIWESGQLQSQMDTALQANVSYMEVVSASREGRPLAPNAVGLARKRAYSALARLSEALQFVAAEPRKSTFDIEQAYTLQQEIYRENARITAVLLTAPDIKNRLSEKPVSCNDRTDFPEAFQ